MYLARQRAEQDLANIQRTQEERLTGVDRLRVARHGSVRHVASCLVVPPDTESDTLLGLIDELEPELKRRIELAAEDVVVAYEQSQKRECERVGHQKVGFDIRSLAAPDPQTGYRDPVTGVRRIEVKGRKRGMPVRLTTNEWYKAQQLGDTYWLYVVWNPLQSPDPVPVMIQNPAKHLDYAKKEVVAARYYDLPAKAVEQAARIQKQGAKVKTEDRRLIEDYLPLDFLNAVASKEKLHPRHYVSLIHYWPARRPTTACRAAVYSALVPAPCSDAERTRKPLSPLSPNSQRISPEPKKIVDEAIQPAYQAIHMTGSAPKVLDMFAGGGAIPLEAARLGCESHAIDYNPVAHLIELCTLVYPQTYGTGLADDFQRWSQILLDRMKQELQDIYPVVQIHESKEVTTQTNMFGGSGPQVNHGAEPMAYIWARTVPCRRPGCNAPVPLVRQSWLRKKGGVVAALPKVENGCDLRWEIVSGRKAKEVSSQESQTGAGQAVCVACNTPAPTDYVKEMALDGRMKESLVAVVVQGRRSKLYLPSQAGSIPAEDQLHSRLVALEGELGFSPPDEPLQGKLRDQLPNYGAERYHELFTPRQLLALFTLITLIRRVHAEMIDVGMAEDRARAIATYFTMAFGRLVVAFNKFTRWEPRVQRTMAAIGDRQALKMVYDFSEINCLAQTQGCLSFALEREASCIRELAKVKNSAVVARGNAEKLFYGDETFDAVITDPPYYSSIYYADLSAFFYVWFKRIVGDLYPEHFTLPTPPKRREAVAQPSEHDGNAHLANEHYQNLMRQSFVEARRVLKPGAPLVCVYAHKTTEGWATLIRALVDAGLTVTEAWPVQTESRSRMNTLGAAALSDSIFFVARRREEAAAGQFENNVEPELHRIARERVVTLWADGKGIGGADLLMAAVGAGLRAYTRYGSVEYANGEPMPAERYLREVEGVVLDVMLDEIFGLRGAAVGSVDSLTRFYVLWRFTYRESSIEAGDAYVFCYPQGIEIDGPLGISGSPPSLVEKSGSKFRVRNYLERGDDESLGMSSDGQPVPLVDVLHRLLWLIDNQPHEIQRFLNTSSPNVEQLRLVTQALCAPVLGRSEAQEATPTRELGALSKLTANWRSVIEGAAYSQKTDRMIKGQLGLPLFSNDND